MCMYTDILNENFVSTSVSIESIFNVKMADKGRRISFQLMIFLFCTTVISKKCENRCCLNYYLHQNGSCLECSLGTYGVNCSGTCVSGYYGRFCRSVCECSDAKCDKKYGCPKDVDIGNVGPKNTNDQWANVAYTLIGSITTIIVVGLLICWKSWFSKRRSPNLRNDQFITSPSENQQEHMYERRRNSSASETDDARSVLQGQGNYTDLQLSEVQPGTSGRDGTDAALSSIAAISPHHTDIDFYDDVEYEHFDKRTGYNVLSLRRNLHGSLLKSVELSSTIDRSSSNMENEYDLMNISHDKEVPPEKLKKRSEEEAVRQSLIDETVKEYIDKSQLMKEMAMKDHTDEQHLKTAPKGSSLLLRKTRTEALSPRAYSLAEGIWSTGNASEDDRILSNQIIMEEVDEECCSNHGKNEKKTHSYQTKNGSANRIKLYATIDDEEDDKLDDLQNINAYEATFTSPQINKKETGEILPPGQSHEYSQVMRRQNDTCVESSTLSIDGFIKNKDYSDKSLTNSVASANDDISVSVFGENNDSSNNHIECNLENDYVSTLL